MVTLSTYYGTSQREAARLFGTSFGSIKYWKQKIVDQSFHPHGGVRRVKQKVSYIATVLLFYIATVFPQSTLMEFSSFNSF